MTRLRVKPPGSSLTTSAQPGLAAGAPEPRALAALLVGFFLLVTAQGLIGLLLPLGAQTRGFGTTVIALVLGCYYAGFVLGCLLVPRLLTRTGRTRGYALLAVVASAAVLIHGFVAAPLAWSVLRALTGFCFAGAYLIVESQLNESATIGNRGRVIAAYLAVDMVALTLGQLLVNVIDPARSGSFAVAAALLLVAAVGPGLVREPATRAGGSRMPAPTPDPPPAPPRASGASFGVAGCLAVGVANGAFWSLGPLYGTAIGLQAAGVSVLMSLVVAAGAAAQLPVGWLSDRLGRAGVLLATGALAAGTSLGLAARGPEATTATFAGVAMLGALMMPLYGLSVAHANDGAPDGQAVTLGARLLLFWAVGAAVGPVLAGAAISVLGPSGLFVHMAAVYALLVGWVVVGLFAVRQASRPTRLRADRVSPSMESMAMNGSPACLPIARGDVLPERDGQPAPTSWRRGGPTPSRETDSTSRRRSTM